MACAGLQCCSGAPSWTLPVSAEPSPIRASGCDPVREPDRQDALSGAAGGRDRRVVAQHHVDAVARRRPGADLRGGELLRRAGLHRAHGVGYHQRQGTGRCVGVHPDRNHDRAQPGGLLSHQQHELRAGADRDQRGGARRLRGRPLRRVYTTDASGLAATKATFDDPDAHIAYPEIVSKEPLGPLVRHGDDQWADIARWVLNAR